ncbi:uncharacterized protein DUF1016 [Pseudorhodoferax soli]|uniref:Uncharacterized protein DUF1016 n=1 Tax=Pseudorhodoferax soli TaxID=545864 RepID=A0A368XE74_9BURK|nr:uncharacterized protein DUF1016 [Pseudorhodoferax soli]
MPSRELSWTHFRLLTRVQDPDAGKWYARDAVSQTWSVAALDRQISTLYYQRLLSSQDKDGVKAEATALITQQAAPDPRDFIRAPYILEFLGGEPQSNWYELDVEQDPVAHAEDQALIGRGRRECACWNDPNPTSLIEHERRNIPDEVRIQRKRPHPRILRMASHAAVAATGFGIQAVFGKSRRDP